MWKVVLELAARITGLGELAIGQVDDLVPPRILDDLPRLDAWLGEEPGASLSLIGRRDPRSMNPWLHNSARLLRGRERCAVQVHPEDARRIGLRAGDQRASARRRVS
jgi:anaerobic selenocysteine-containing dehydrogenase